MSHRDPRVDRYIEAAEPFARPILQYLRELVHEAEPEMEETIKWRFPNFVKDGIVCSMAAFKGHCAFGFWKADLVLGREGEDGDGMGNFGRITAIEDLPPRETLMGYVREAVALNEAGVKSPVRIKGGGGSDVPLHDAFRAALDANPEAREGFERLSPSHRREYAEWIAEAKREETRARRIGTALEWISEGKPRNWKYMKGRSS